MQHIQAIKQGNQAVIKNGNFY